MRKMLSSLILTTVLLGLASTAVGIEKIRIGVVDVHEVVQKAPQAATISKNLQKKFKSREEEIISKQKRLHGNVEKLNRDSSVMSDSKRKDLQDKILTERRALQRLQQDFQEDLNMAQTQALQELLSRISNIVKGIAKSGKYDLILDKRAVPYANSSVDITDRVIKELK